MPMDRTPIKIPGKNKRDNSKAAVAARKALNRPRGRPLKLPANPPAASVSQVEVTKAPRKRSMKNIKPRRKMSNLEKLPTELLIHVFLYCMNINLPRSSPVIGGKLTSELVYTRVVIAAFGPTWEKGFGKVYNSAGSSEVTLSEFPPEDDPSPISVADGGLQSAILRCRWASLPIVQRSQQIWIDKHGKGRDFKPLPYMFDADEGVEKELEKARLERRLTPAEFFEEDFAAFSRHEQGRAAADTSFQWNTYTDVAGDCEIPESLLLGPWDEEKTRFLYWLVKGGAGLEWLKSISGEIAMMGLKKAITAGDLRVIHLLNWAGLHYQLDIETVVWAIKHAAKSRFKVAARMLAMWEISHHLGHAEQSAIVKALGEVKDRAVVEVDEETIAFVQEVKALLDIRE